MPDDMTPLPPEEDEPVSAGEPRADEPAASLEPPVPPAAEPLEPPVPPAAAPRVTPVEPIPPAPAEPPRRSGGVWWGVVLVFVGAALLVGQFLPYVQAWRFWPLIIIAIGIRQLFGPSTGGWTIRHLGEGLSTIAIGAVFLGQMLGYLQWDVWLNILRLWPLLLVSLGLEIIGKAIRSEFVRFLSSIVVIAGFAYGALVMTQTSGFPLPFITAGEAESFSYATSNEANVESGEANVEGGVGSMSITAGSDLVTAEGASPFEPVFEVSSGASSADVRVGLGEGVWAPTEPSSRLDVTLDESVTWDLQVDAGVSTYDLDLRDLALSHLILNAGVSDGTLVLGEVQGTDPVLVEVSSGISALTIRVPEGSSVRVTVDGGFTSTNAKGEWDSRRDNDEHVYESESFSESSGFWDIRIDAGFSGTTIEYY